jgi:RNA polymerase sigma-70 factor (ECF subfamily)
VQSAWNQGDFDSAATQVLEGYGAEILGFLVTRVNSRVDAGAVFSDFCEDFWRGLPGFQWRCSVRGWAYTLARHAADRYLRDPKRKRERNLTLPADSKCSRVVHKIKTGTLPHQKTEIKDRVQALRNHLPDDDRMLLTLRVDRDLTWEELALVMAENAGAMSGEQVQKESARLRKRFQRIKEQLKELARSEGLLK